jgi:hypothetical protein
LRQFSDFAAKLIDMGGNGEAVSAVQWLIAKVIAAVDDNEPPMLSS